MQRITVIIPEALIEAANHVHVLLGKATHFATYTEPKWQDASGNLYAVSSGLWSDVQIAGVINPAIIMQMVSEDRVPEGVDLALCGQAQAAFVFWSPDTEGDLPSPSIWQTGSILAMVGDDPLSLLDFIGASRSVNDTV